MQDNGIKQFWRYDITLRILHWIMAILLISLIALGFYMTSIEDAPGSSWYFNLHKSLGLIAAALILMRIFWRLTHKPVPLPEPVIMLQVKISRLVHFLLYICMVLMPLTGYLGATFSKHGIAFFGLQLPQWVNANHDVAEQFFEIHETIAWVLIVLISLHVLAAFQHLFLKKDGVFRRM
jgi:cytochrome b561